ncbi:MAG: ATP-binding protein [Ramlibacter sp.]|nr:ATP-binding protein [Ramlibacter sp.]
MSIAKASPAKRFFVEMLTRDIELADAILDLLDNCIDGALRSGSKDPQQPYKGYHAHIDLRPKHFRIEDNCGGIPRELAEEHAFRFGRKDRGRDQDLPTVGVYGIGMKRAIFKLGTNCTIESKHGTEEFSVVIDKNWIDDDDKWELELSNVAPSLKTTGTKIDINQLHFSVVIAFSQDKGGFVDDFYQIVQRHYSYVIEKGFEIRINGKPVLASTLQTLFDASDFEEKGAIKPYVYETEHDGVIVNLVMGLYEKLPTDQEQEDSEKGVRNKESAGWTIVCNDRVVVSSDKTRLTGWGEAGVPAYHSQFIALAGIVIFKCNDAIKLPVTTTKRGIDQNSELFGHVKEVMRDALKHFTSFTNKWKAQTPERDDIQGKVKAIDIRSAAISIPADKWKMVKKGIQGRRFVPTLPEPEQENRTRRIQFVKPIEEIATIGTYLLDDAKAKPADVGIATFEWALKKARSV